MHVPINNVFEKKNNEFNSKKETVRVISEVSKTWLCIKEHAHSEKFAPH